MERTKFPARVRTKFKTEPQPKTKFLKRNCPPKGKIWTDEKGKIHKGLLIRHVNKARKKGYQRLVFTDPKNSNKTIILLKARCMKRTK